jgi:hypothetical protein
MSREILGGVYYQETDLWAPPSVFGENGDRDPSLPTLVLDRGPSRDLGGSLASHLGVHLGVVTVLRSSMVVDTQAHCWV